MKKEPTYKVGVYKKGSCTIARNTPLEWLQEQDGKVLYKKSSLKVRKCMPLGVYDWMSNRGERFRISTSDAAIQLDLVAKVRAVASAENYFLSLPDTLKDRRIYGALLNAMFALESKRRQNLCLIK
ncbi:unnamed protein product [Prunus armeniaca]